VFWVNNDTKGSRKHAVILGIVGSWGSTNCVVLFNTYRETQKLRYFTGHGMVLTYRVIFLLGSKFHMHFIRPSHQSPRLGLSASSLTQVYADLANSMYYI
jgi:hypothetical protein